MIFMNSVADKLYFEPLTAEDVQNIVEQEKPWGAVVQFGGQTAIKLAKALTDMGGAGAQHENLFPSGAVVPGFVLPVVGGVVVGCLGIELGMELNVRALKLDKLEGLYTDEIEELLVNVTDERLFVVAEALRRGFSPKKIYSITKMDIWFLDGFELHVAPALDLQGGDDVQGGGAEHLELPVGQGLGGGHHDGVAGMDAHGVDVLHGADGDHVAGAVPHDLKLNLLPAGDAPALRAAATCSSP